MRKLVAVLALMFGSIAAMQAVAEERSPIGKWLTEAKDAQIEIVACDNKLCGSIVWLREPLDEQGQTKLDKKNPDPEKRKQTILGLPLLSGFVKSANAAEKWEEGRIYNPDDGDLYRCTMTLESPTVLKVRGYVGIPLLGKTQTWTRVE